MSTTPSSWCGRATTSPSVEIVVTRTPLYLIVEKTGEAAEYVTEHLEDQ